MVRGSLVFCLVLAAFLPRTLGHCPNQPCPPHPHPHYVCGTDGKTYSSECHLERAICFASLLGQTIRKAYDGRCSFGGGTGGGGGGGFYPQCRQCYNDVYQPVCGTDGRTYPSRCKLEQAECLTQRHIDVLYNGPCHDGHHGTGTGTHVDHCRRYCPTGGPQVCGSDGLTYANDCELLKASCTLHSLVLKHRGPCAQHGGSGHGVPGGIGSAIGNIIGGAIGSAIGGYEEHRPHCNQNQYCPFLGRRVCGSDGRIYRNQCELRKAACVNLHLTEAHISVCRHGGGGTNIHGGISHGSAHGGSTHGHGGHHLRSGQLQQEGEEEEEEQLKAAGREEVEVGEEDEVEVGGGEDEEVEVNWKSSIQASSEDSSDERK